MYTWVGFLWHRKSSRTNYVELESVVKLAAKRKTPNNPHNKTYGKKGAKVLLWFCRWYHCDDATHKPRHILSKYLNDTTKIKLSKRSMFRMFFNTPLQTRLYYTCSAKSGSMCSRDQQHITKVATKRDIDHEGLAQLVLRRLEQNGPVPSVSFPKIIIVVVSFSARLSRKRSSSGDATCPENPVGWTIGAIVVACHCQQVHDGI